MHKIVIVDDEEIVRHGLTKRIRWEDYGFEIAGDAGDAEQALELMEKVHPDLLITDIRMPGKSGLELIEESKKKWPELFVIVLSAYDDFSYAQDAMYYGAAGYLLKPIEPDALDAVMHKIRNLMQKREIEERISGDSFKTAEQDETDIVARAKNYVMHQYQTKLTLEMVAQECYTSPTYLSNVFKAKTGCNFVDYVTDLKISKAKQLLRYSDYRVRDVALQIGFDDYTYFCKVFKKITGETPLQFRCRMKEKNNGNLK